MVTYVKGDIFNSSAQVLTNAVNCVGVMGKGVALEFKKRYPSMFEDYKKRCELNQIKPGHLYLWENDKVQILNFPTKRHWQDQSLLSDIEDGLKFLANNYIDLGIDSLAMPAIGCGLGGLDWNQVKPLIDKYLGYIPDLEVYVYESLITASLNNDDFSKSNLSLPESDKSVAKPADL